MQPCEIISPVQLSDTHFQWSKDGEPVEIAHDGWFQINHNGSLIITFLLPSDSGMYQVNISNDKGSALHTVQLLISMRPARELFMFVTLSYS